MIREEVIGEEYLENYVLTIYNDNTYNQVLIKYPKLAGGDYDVLNAEVTVIVEDLLISRTFCAPNEVISTGWDENVNCVDLPCGSNVGSGGANDGGGTEIGSGTGWTNTTDPENNTVPKVPIIDVIGSLKKILGYLTGTPEGDWIDASFESYAIAQFLDINGNTSESIQFAQEAIQALMYGTVSSFEEYIQNEVNALLADNPFLLTEIDCNQIQNWQALAQHEAPQSVNEKIIELQENNEAAFGDWNIQHL